LLNLNSPFLPVLDAVPGAAVEGITMVLPVNTTLQDTLAKRLLSGIFKVSALASPGWCTIASKLLAGAFE
jgi:hypothetical protein